MAKSEMSISVPEELKEELQKISEKELRSLTGQVVYFLLQSVERYKLSTHSVR